MPCSVRRCYTKRAYIHCSSARQALSTPMHNSTGQQCAYKQALFRCAQLQYDTCTHSLFRYAVMQYQLFTEVFNHPAALALVLLGTGLYDNQCLQSQRLNTTDYWECH